MTTLALPPQVFVILAGLVEERVGLHYGPEDRDTFAAKAGVRAADAGFTSMMDYYYHLRYDDPDRVEFDALVEALVVPETYLFRELDPLRVAVDELLAPRAGRFRIWDAACSTGEEAFTLAMLLDHRGALDRAEIVASDVSERALARARSGRLGPRAIRGAPSDLPVDRWVRPNPGGGYVVEPGLVERIRFARVNLLDDDEIARLGTFELVVCRNVLIYFADETARRVVAALTRALRPDGALIVGASESLLRLDTALRIEERSGAFLYRKVAGS